MTDNVESENTDLFHKEQSKDEMKRHVISFALMIIFTLASFGIVASGSFAPMVAIPLILGMAIIQVAFQFFYFMHMKDKDHEIPSTLIYGGVWCALLVLVGLGVISWW